MNKRHYEHTLPNIRGSLSNTYIPVSYHFIYVVKLENEEQENPTQKHDNQ